MTTETEVALADGGRELFTSLYGRSYNRTVGFLINRGASNEDAEEAVQEAGFRAYKKFHTYRGDGQASFNTWFTRIAVNCLLNKFKKRRPGLSANGVLEGIDTELNPLESLLERGLTERVHEVLGTLFPNQRAVLELRSFEGLKYGEIATTLGLETEAAARQAFSRAGRQFKATYKRLYSETL